MRVLVTGGAGFIGSHLVDMLLDLGHEVTVLDDFSTGRWENLTTAWGGPPIIPPPGVSMSSFWTKSPHRPLLVQPGTVTWQANITDVMAWEPEVIFHLAAQIDVRASAEHPQRDAEVNVIGTLNMLQAAVEHGVRRFIFVSSAAVFGDIHIFPHVGPGTAPQPISPYGASKAAVELYVELYDRMGIRGEHDMVCTTVVLSNVYGPRQRPGVGAVNIFARALLAGGRATLFGDGHNVRDYVYVTDAARALAWAGRCLRSDAIDNERPVHGRVLVGTGVGTRDIDVVQQIGQNDIPGLLPGHLLPVDYAPARPVDIRSMVFPAGHGMTPTTLAEGVRLTVQEIRKEMGL